VQLALLENRKLSSVDYLICLHVIAVLVSVESVTDKEAVAAIVIRTDIILTNTGNCSSSSQPRTYTCPAQYRTFSMNIVLHWYSERYSP
jgi:hypothetical protein